MISATPLTTRITKLCTSGIKKIRADAYAMHYVAIVQEVRVALLLFQACMTVKCSTYSTALARPMAGGQARPGQPGYFVR